MAQRPLSEMADFGYERMSEESGYILHELKQFESLILSRVEGIEKTVDNFNSPIFLSALDEIRGLKAHLASVNIISVKLDKLTAALKTLAEKLDSEDVANLDSDYLGTVKNELA